MSDSDIRRFFAGASDPRVERTRRHALVDVIVMAVLAVVCGAETWQDVGEFGMIREAWLTRFLEVRHGIPSTSAFKRIFRALDPAAFSRAFVQWTQALVGTSLEGKLVAIDGKTLRGSYTGANKKHPLHWVTAWVADNQVVFGQGATEAKSNEITAIPKLLEMLALHGATAAIDAMGCQRAIAEQIVQAGGHYVLRSRETRLRWPKRIGCAFVTADIDGEALDASQRYEQTEKAHGRVETRTNAARTRRSPQRLDSRRPPLVPPM